MFEYYRITPKTNTPIKRKTNKPASKTKIVFYFIFFGCAVGAMIVGSLSLFGGIISIISRGPIALNDIGVLYFLILTLLFYYPAAIIIAGVPATMTGLTMMLSRKITYKKAYAFIIGFMSCYIFYFFIFKNTTGMSLGLSIIGGLSALATQYKLEKIETA